MKGLLKKDFYMILFQYWKLLAFGIIFIGIYLSASHNSTENISFAVGYLSMLSVMVSIASISYDDADHCTSFLMTLPITRRLYAVEKYVFGLLCLVTCWGITSLLSLSFSLSSLEWKETLVSLLGILLVMCILMSITLPFQLKYGTEKGRIVLVGIVIIIFVVLLFAKQLFVMLNKNPEQFLSNLSRLMNGIPLAVLAGCAIGFVVLIVVLSLLISIHIMEKKVL